MKHAFTLGLCALFACACIELPDFERASLVRDPRVIALIAEPPEVRPGEDFELSLLLVGTEPADDVQITWRACGSFDAMFGGGGAQYGEQQPDEGCGGGLAFPLGEGERATLPGTLTAGLFDNLEVIAMSLGTALPEGIIDQIRGSVGLAFLIEATVIVDGKRIRAVKRVLISESETPHTNPPPPRFAFGNDIVIQGDADMRCTAEDGEEVIAAPDATIELKPAVDPDTDEEPWLETYRVIDARGDLLERNERAFYSWFTTAGDLEQGSTKSPLRNELWYLPHDPGPYPLWVVVRDGHGGVSACELTVTVEEN